MSVTPNFLMLDSHDWLVTQSIGIMLVMLENVVDMLIQVQLRAIQFMTHSVDGLQFTVHMKLLSKIMLVIIVLVMDSLWKTVTKNKISFRDRVANPLVENTKRIT